MSNDNRITRPKTLADAKRLILDTFASNDWSESERLRYQDLLGLPSVPVESLDITSVRVIIEDMAKSKMILFEEKENEN
jgi:hypothetical protein